MKDYVVVYNQKNGLAAVLYPVNGDGFSDVPVRITKGEVAVPCSRWVPNEGMEEGYTLYSSGDLIHKGNLTYKGSKVSEDMECEPVECWSMKKNLLPPNRDRRDRWHVDKPFGELKNGRFTAQI